MSAANRRHVDNLLPAFALGSLEEAELGTVQEHLQGCNSCQARLREYEELVGLIGLALPPAQPARALKRRVLAGLKFPRDAAGLGLADRVRRFWSVPKVAPVWAAAGVLPLVLLFVLNLTLWRRLQPEEAVLAQMSSRTVALSATESAPGARGLLIYPDEEPSGMLVVEELPALEPGLQYQLWLIRDGERTSGGVFSVSPGGYGSLIVSAPLPLGTYQAFGITVEPFGGSPGPTGSKVLGGGI